MTDPLIVDVFAGDLNGRPDWAKLAAAGQPWAGAVIKATEGLHYAPSWFGDQWQAIRDAGGDRYGDTWFRGCYHYLRFAQDATEQARYYCAAVERAGGWDHGDIMPIVDVERANNPGSTKQQVIDSVYEFVHEIGTLTGRDVLLYGGELLYSLGITERMGCAGLWIARYAATLPANVYQRIGWDKPTMWQYCGDGESYLAGYPHESPIGKVDISAVTAGLDWLREQCC